MYVYVYMSCGSVAQPTVVGMYIVLNCLTNNLCVEWTMSSVPFALCRQWWWQLSHHYTYCNNRGYYTCVVAVIILKSLLNSYRLNWGIKRISKLLNEMHTQVDSLPEDVLGLLLGGNQSLYDIAKLQSSYIACYYTEQRITALLASL